MNRAALIFIILIATVLRLWQLGNVPPSPDWDEVALGYNAYSLLQTGKDEYGQDFPIILRSFDDYKPALYAYLAIPSVALFGLNVVATRLPSVLFGILTVIATYFLLKELFNRGSIALFASFLLAISPWHIQFSRIAFESNVGLALNVAAILFFLKALKKPWFLTLSALFAGLSLHVYQSEKVFLPLLFLLLAVIFRKELLGVPKKYLGIAVLVGLTLIIPLGFYVATQEQALLRARGVSFFADTTPFLGRTADRLFVDNQTGDAIGKIFDNRRITYIVAAIGGYASHFDFNWLFISGDQPRHHAPNMGLLYLIEFPFMLIGIYHLIFGNFSKATKLVIFAWFFIAPVPASITSGVPHSIRTLNFLPVFQILIALGIIFAVQKISPFKFRKILICGCLLLFVFNIAYYLNQYFVQQNYYFSEYWQYGYKEAVEEVKRIEGKYTKIIVSNKPHLDQSYMFFLFHLAYPPAQYQEEAKNASGGFRENHAFGKYEFRPIEWERELKGSEILFVGRPEDFPSDAHTVKTIHFLNGKEAIRIIEG